MKILENISLKPYTNFKIGGNAHYFCEPKNKEEIIESLEFANDNNLPTFILGLGANILVNDEGFPGLVIRQRNEEIYVKDEIITASSGTTMENLIKKALAENLIGIEDFSGIPSTVGGALYINLHYYNSFIGPLINSALVVNKNTLMLEEIDKDWFGFGYDTSKLKNNKDFILIEASFLLRKVCDNEKYEALGKSKEIIRTRLYKYPQEPSVGSVFQNLTTEEKEKYNLPTRSVAYLIDVCGLKGKRVGDAMISPRHANIIINVGSATAKDVINLANLVKHIIKERFDIDLRFEMELVGFM